MLALLPAEHHEHESHGWLFDRQSFPAPFKINLLYDTFGYDLRRLSAIRAIRPDANNRAGAGIGAEETCTRNRLRSESLPATSTEDIGSKITRVGLEFERSRA